MAEKEDLMTQKDYILRIFEEIGRAIAQVVYQREIKDYEAAHALLDEQFKQALGMGKGFIHSLSDEALLSLLATPGMLNIDKCWLIAMLLKAEGAIYEDQHDESNSYNSYLKACNLFLEALSAQYQQKDIEQVTDVEILLDKLDEYELPLRTQELLFWYFEHTGRYGRAQNSLFEILDIGRDKDIMQSEEVEEMLEKGKAFYARLVCKSDENLGAGNVSRAEIEAGLAQIHTYSIWSN